MKSALSLLFFIILVSNTFTAWSNVNGHRIEVKIRGLYNADLILGYHFDQRMLVSDTARVNSAGVAVFESNEPLPGGLYLFYLPGGRFFDVLISDDQHFRIETDTLDFIANMRVEGSVETSLFHQYQKFIVERQTYVTQLRNALGQAGEDATRIKELEARIEEVNFQVRSYWDKAQEEHDGTFFATFIRSLQEPALPDFYIPAGTANPDSVMQMQRYLFFRHHYLDNIDFTDARLLRTPTFPQRLRTYFDHVIMQIPDTVSRASIEVIEKGRGNPEVFRYLVQFLFNRANESNIMGMDAVMVALADKYYLSGEATWASEEFLRNLAERVAAIRPTLIGNIAHDLKMEGINGEVFRLHEVNAMVTILVFYEPACGHCQVELPRLYREVFEPYRHKGVQVFAVYSLADRVEWETFVNQHGLHGWINVYDPFHQTRFRSFYDIRSTPMIYVLDRQKRIVGKRLASEQLPGFINHLLSL